MSLRSMRFQRFRRSLRVRLCIQGNNLSIMGFESWRYHLDCLRIGTIFLNKLVSVVHPSRFHLAIIIESGLS